MGRANSIGATPRAPVVLRRRLVELLVSRFEARLTIVVGGGGSGKTTALSQAMASEHDHVDVWYPCSRGDRDGAELLAGLARTTFETIGGADPTSIDSPAPLDSIHDAVLATSPRHVCLIVDDVQVLDDRVVLDELLDALPSNGHLLLAGRRHPGVSSARLDAAGGLAEIGQDDLLLNAAEQREFANLRGVDVECLESAGGWPAFVELASTGIEVRSRRYLEEEALAGLTIDRRGALARFAAVGGGNDDLAQAVTGWPLDDLVADLPLVRWSGDVAQLHDLWRELLLEQALDDAQHGDAVHAATTVLRAAGDVDRAIELAASVGAWSDVEQSISVAVRAGVEGGLRYDQLMRWRLLLPADRNEHGVAALIDALVERERDPTSEAAERLFDRAAQRFDDEGVDDLQLAALAQLGYLARISGEIERIEAVMDRIRSLSHRYPPAAPFLEFGEAWKALGTARPDLELAAMERIADSDLPPVWQVTRDHLIAHALFNLGRPRDAIERVPVGISKLPVPIPGALVTESQCWWFAGEPARALEVQPAGLDARYGARDRYIAGLWIAAMHAYAGQVEAAREAIHVGKAHLGEHPPPMLLAQSLAVEIIVAIAERREADGARTLREVLELAPLGGGVSEQFLRNHIPIPYVLVPETRTFWDHAELAGVHHTAYALAHALVAARSGDSSELSRLSWPEPGVVAVHLPAPWAIEFALHGVRAGRHEARLLVTWLCEQLGEPSRRALGSFADDHVLGPTAVELLAQTPSPPRQRTELRVLSDTELLLDGYPSADPNWRRERVRALLVWLALQRTTTREQAAGALWPDLPGERAAKNLRTTLNYLHDVLEPRRRRGDATWFVRVDGHRIRLHESLDVDLWRFGAVFDEAEAAERDGHPLVALPLFIEAASLWSGDVAADLDHEWLDLERIHVRSRFVRASCRAAELLVATDSPGEAIEIIRPALAADPYHHRSYRALAGAYAALGDATSERAVLRRAEEHLEGLSVSAPHS